MSPVSPPRPELAAIHQAMIIGLYWTMERDHMICGGRGGSEGVKGQQPLTVINWGMMKEEVC